MRFFNDFEEDKKYRENWGSSKHWVIVNTTKLSINARL